MINIGKVTISSLHAFFTGEVDEDFSSIM